MRENIDSPSTQKLVQKKPTYVSEVLLDDTPTPSGLEVVKISSTPVSAANGHTPRPNMSLPKIADTPLAEKVTYPAQAPQRGLASPQSGKRAERDAAYAQMVQERCRQLSLSLFFREHSPIRSLGFTSSLRGEGKSFLALLMANVLAQDSSQPVTLLECNWEHPCFHEHFGFSATPGLAEWLRGECHERDIRHKVHSNLSVIPAGNARGNPLRLLQQLRQKSLLETIARTDGLLVVDLPSIVTSAYGSLAASLVDSLVVVVRAGVTPDTMIAETCAQLKDLPVHGLLLNQVQSRIPHWIRQIL